MIADLGDPIKPYLEELYRRAPENVYWRSKRPGLSPDEVESARNILATAIGQSSEPLANSGTDENEELLFGEGRPYDIGAGEVLGTRPKPQSSGATGDAEDIMLDEAGESGAPGAAELREQSPGRTTGQWKAGGWTKPPLPLAEADAREVRRFDPNIPEHAKGADGEEQLARIVHSLPDEVVVRWGDPIGWHGPDIVSVNLKTGDVTLWDGKFRGRKGRIQESSTFKADSKPRKNAIKEAILTLRSNKTLPPDIRDKAIQNLRNRNIKTRTAGFGNAKNSILGK